MSESVPRLIHGVTELREAIDPVRSAGRRIGLVPTMGALHEGHLSLVRASRDECDLTVVSIFVNPTQFGPNEDFQQYPRTLEDDVRRLAESAVDMVFAPAAEEVYRPGHAAWVEPGGVAEPLEGQRRPGHFRGVATVVLKLLNMVQPDVAYFGRKDFQQLLVIRQMVDDLNVPVVIRDCPIVREPDGLAMSSRNRYLSPAARRRALGLSIALQRAGEIFARGPLGARKTIATIRREIESCEPTDVPLEIDYVALRDPETFAPVDEHGEGEIRRPVVALLAVRVDGTRLIDNALLIPGGPPASDQ